MLIHCQAGADRTGVVSVLAAMAVGGQDYDSARNQLSWKTFHIDNDSEKIGGLLDKYERWCASRRLPHGGWEQFKDWRDDVSSAVLPPGLSGPRRRYAGAGFRQGRDGPPDQPLRHDPAGRRGGTCLRAGVLGRQRPERAAKYRVRPAGGAAQGGYRPRRQPGSHVPTPRPSAAGRYEVHFDVIEGSHYWFAEQGSAVAAMTVDVQPPIATAPAGPAAEPAQAAAGARAQP